MAVAIQLVELPGLHSRLYWEPIIVASAAVFSRAAGAEPSHNFSLSVEGVYGFGTEIIEIEIGTEDVRPDDVDRLRRTLEPSRQVELAAIAIAGIGLHLAGGHQMVDLAAHGSGADYLVDASRIPLEIAGRSRRRDLDQAWEQKEQRLIERRESGVYICVCEFATMTGRLSYLE
jgi:hypothetical protein